MKFAKFLPSPFYRVAIKVILKDDKDRLLVVGTADGWEMPGGGWEHGETFEECIKREVDEELSAELESYSGVRAVYRGPNIKKYMALRLLVEGKLKSNQLKAKDPNILEFKYATKEELRRLKMGEDESPIKDLSHIIWPA